MRELTANAVYPVGLPDWSRQILSLGLGLGATWMIFFGLSRVQRTPMIDGAPPIDDIREIALPVEPPPPTIQPKEVPPIAMSNLIVVASGRSESVVKLPALPLIAETASRVLGAPRIDFSAKEFKPTEIETDFDSRHVFDRHEVDQPCVPLVKVRPQVARFMLHAAASLRVTYMFIVNRDGTVEGLKPLRSSGNPHLDKACAQALADWKFAPAIRRGRTVRQWVQQTIVFKVDGGSPFEP
jgi:TonB family protein